MHQQKTEAQELNGLTSTENQDNLDSNSQNEVEDKEQINYHEPILHTPFAVVGNERGHFITFQHFVLTQPMETKEKALEFLKTHPFELGAMHTMALLDMRDRGNKTEE